MEDRLFVGWTSIYHIVRHFLKSISTSSTLRNFSSKVLALSFSRESKKEDMGLDSKMYTTLRVTIGRLFFKKVFSLRLSITFLPQFLKEYIYYKLE